MAKAKTVKMCDMSVDIASRVFEMLNPGKVRLLVPGDNNGMCTAYLIITDVEPKELTYPEGWYYAKGCFRNKHQSTTGFYGEVIMVTSEREFWKNIAIYCTAVDD